VPPVIPSFGLLGSLVPQSPRRPIVPRRAEVTSLPAPAEAGTLVDTVTACGWSFNEAAPGCGVIDSGVACSQRPVRSIGPGDVCSYHHAMLVRVKRQLAS